MDDKSKIKEIITDMLVKGFTPAQIQQKLAEEHQIKMTYLDLKLMLSELENISQKLDQNSDNQESVKQKINDTETDSHEESVDAELMDEEDTVIELDTIHRPGAVLSGKVKFASGVRADWAIDHMGRFTLENATGKPDQNDIILFQEALQKKIGG